MEAFHSVWTAPFFSLREIGGGARPAAYEMDDFELLTTILSALKWREKNGPVRLVTDGRGADYFHRLGLEHLWDAGVHPFRRTPEACGIDPFLLWAAGKMYALAEQAFPMVMIDTDFIVWERLAEELAGTQVAVIHREELDPAVYPGREAFRMKPGYAFDAGWDWSEPACNTALCYIADGDFARAYTAVSMDFMLHLAGGGSRVTGMVFAEQRLLAMCARARGVPIHALETLGSLAPGRQRRFTHLWGYKEILHRDPAHRAAFCRRCIARILRDFPEEQCALRRIAAFKPFFAQGPMQEYIT